MSTESIAPVDPRIQVELEKLNTATDNINKYEVELDEAKSEFKRLLAESVVRIKQSAHKLGNSIEAAKPYYESRIYATQLAKETQEAAVNYEKAKSIHVAAKEMVYLAEQGLGEKSTIDTACQEMLTHAAGKVNQAQIDVTNASNSLRMYQLKLEVANNRVGKLQGQLKAAIKASRPFYETRANYNGIMKIQKEKINELESKVSESKMIYNAAFKNLEQISEEIHRQREMRKKMYNCENILTDNEEMLRENIQLENTNFPCDIDTKDEYLEIHKNLNNNSEEHDFTNLLHDFERILTLPPPKLPGVRNIPKSASTTTANEHFLRGPYELKSSSTSLSKVQNNNDSNNKDDTDIEQWTEIRLSHSGSTSSSYSNQSLHDDETAAALLESRSPSSSEESRRKVTCTTLFQEDEQVNKKQTLSQWLSRTNSLKNSGRRQSLDLLIDASDKVKDAFNLGFQKVGKTLERRNSESEMNVDNISSNKSGTVGGNYNTTTATTNSSSATTDYFLFSRSSEPKELLSDEQVENLFLNPSLNENGLIVVEGNKSHLQQNQTLQLSVNHHQMGLKFLPF